MAKKRGPKIIEIDWEQFDKLCHIQCTLREISNWFSCSEDTIERRVKEHSGLKFADYYDQKRSKGLVSIRRKQYEVAMSGSIPLLIWLGKQYLGQSDNQNVGADHLKEIELTITKHVKAVD